MKHFGLRTTNVLIGHNLPASFKSRIRLRPAPAKLQGQLLHSVHQLLLDLSTSSAGSRPLLKGKMESLPSLQRCFALSRPTQRIFSTSTSIRSMRRRRQQQQQPQQLPCSSSSRATRTLTTSSIRLGDRQQNRQSSPPQPEQSSNVSKTWKQMMESMKPMQPTTTTTSREGPGGASTATGNMSAFRGQKSQSRLLAGLNESIARHALDQDAMARELAMAGTSSIALRLKPSLGRTVDGVYGEPARAFRALERKCSENKVKSDSMAQKRHVRRGQRRKDMRMLRWRRLFREGFIAECGKIRRMRKQGW